MNRHEPFPDQQDAHHEQEHREATCQERHRDVAAFTCALFPHGVHYVARSKKEDRALGGVEIKVLSEPGYCGTGKPLSLGADGQGAHDLGVGRHTIFATLPEYGIFRAEFDLEEATVADLVKRMESGSETAESLARKYLARIEAGEGRDEFVPLLDQMCKHLYRSYCAFAPGAAAPVESLLTHFKDELREHIRQKKCPFKGSKDSRGPGFE